MRGKKLIKDIDPELLKQVSKDYKKLLLNKKIKDNLVSIGEIGVNFLMVAGVLAGAVILATVAPNVIAAVGKLTKNKKEKIYFNCSQKQFNKTLSYLKNRHLIQISNDEAFVKLTKKGVRRYQIQLFENMVISKPKRWDNIWRIVIFDILEKFKIAREALRQKLNDLGFYQIQKSVFVIPYPCEKEIDFIRHTFGLEEQVRVVKSHYFQGEDEVKSYFGLK